MHDYAFVVAGANTAQMVADFRVAVDRAVNDGIGFDEFKKQYQSIAAKHRFDASNHRARLIYQTNLYASYNRGRYEQQYQLKDILPYWQYEHNDSANPRKHHQALNGVVYRADDPWWDSYYPPRGYNCHCTVRALSEADVVREGLSITDAPAIEYQTLRYGGQLMQVPVGVDPAFRRSMPPVDALLLKPLVDKPPALVARIIQNILKHPQAVALLNRSMQQMVQTVTAEKVARGAINYVGVIPNKAIDALTQKQLAPASAVIAVRDGDVLHALRDSKQARGASLPVSFWENLPEKLKNPAAILLQRAHQQRNKNATDVLLFVYHTDKGKVAIKLDYEIKLKNSEGKKVPIKLNMVRTASVLMDAKEQLEEFEVLYGEIK